MAIDNPAAEAVKPVKVAKNDDDIALEQQNRMRDYFSKQKKVSVKTREDEWVQVNGYTFVIKGGERVEVPEDIALLLEQGDRI